MQRDAELSGQVVTACLAGLPERLCNRAFANAFLFDFEHEIRQSDADRGYLDDTDSDSRLEPWISHPVKIERDGSASNLFLDYLYRPQGLDHLSLYDYITYFEKIDRGDLKSGTSFVMPLSLSNA